MLILYYALVSFYSYYSFILALFIVFLRVFYQYQMLSYGLTQRLLKIVYYYRYSNFLTVFCYYCCYCGAYYQLYRRLGLLCKSCTSRNYFIGEKAAILAVAIDSYFVIRFVLSYFAWKIRTNLDHLF